MSRVPLIHQDRVPSPAPLELTVSTRDLGSGSHSATRFEQASEVTTPAMTRSASVTEPSSAGSSPLTELSDSSSSDPLAIATGGFNPVSNTQPISRALKSDDFTIHVHPFEKYPLIESHLHPKFVILQTGVEIEQLGLTSADLLFNQHPILRNIYKILKHGALQSVFPKNRIMIRTSTRVAHPIMEVMLGQSAQFLVALGTGIVGRGEMTPTVVQAKVEATNKPD
jgi:hypothetical protein